MSHPIAPPIVTTNSWAVRMADSVLQNYPESKWKWHYEHGLVVQAIAAIGESRFQDVDQARVDRFVTADGEIRTYRVGEFNLDQINPGKLLFSVYRRSGDERYAAAIRLLRKQMREQPRTPSGGYWHKQIYPNQMWLDGVYMAEPFQAECAFTFNEPELFDEITRQFILMENHTRDPQTGLLYHGWDESKAQKWANPATGCSPHFWGRAIGWYVMALVDVLDFLPTEHPQRPTLLDILSRLAAALVRFQDSASGLWYQIIDQPQRPGNYRESSASAMLAYGFAKAVRQGWLATEYLSAARRAYRGLLENMIRVDARGLVSLEGTCSVAGLGGDPYRDGSFNYYINEPIVANDFKGVGPFILAALEMEKVKAE
ncbi:MAG: glycoside hydrolase family 88 protein [Anaerolineae bacterium]|nr:glycoside hydrolase family 88 protein [Anaerolineae bacterium]